MADLLLMSQSRSLVISVILDSFRVVVFKLSKHLFNLAIDNILFRGYRLVATKGHAEMEILSIILFGSHNYL